MSTRPRRTGPMPSCAASVEFVLWRRPGNIEEVALLADALPGRVVGHLVEDRVEQLPNRVRSGVASESSRAGGTQLGCDRRASRVNGRSWSRMRRRGRCEERPQLRAASVPARVPSGAGRRTSSPCVPESPSLPSARLVDSSAAGQQLDGRGQVLVLVREAAEDRRAAAHEAGELAGRACPARS